jgi:hypothetical protein
METDKTILAEMERRLHRLERQSRLFRAGALLVVLAIGSLALMAFQGGAGDDKAGIGKFRQIDAGHIVLRDTDGQMRAWLGIAEGGPRLIFFDASGQQRMGVGMTRQGEPALGIYDGGENPRVVLGMLEGWPGFVLRDPQGKKRVAIFSRDDWGSMFFYDKFETKRTGMGQFGEAAAINLCDDRGKDRAGISTDRKGSSLSFFDIAGMKRVGLGLLSKDEPALGIFDEEGYGQAALETLNSTPIFTLYGTNRTSVVMSVNPTNGPRLEVFDSYHRPVWSAPGAEHKP